jgi:hypothetical protein
MKMSMSRFAFGLIGFGFFAGSLASALPFTQGQTQRQMADIFKRTLQCETLKSSSMASEISTGFKTLKNSWKGNNHRIGDLVEADFQSMIQYCASSDYQTDLKSLQDLKSQSAALLQGTTLNWVYGLGLGVESSNDPQVLNQALFYQNPKAEWAIEEKAKAQFTMGQFPQPGACPSVSTDAHAVNNPEILHDYFLQNGYLCTASEFKRLSQLLNQEHGRPTAIADFESTDSMSEADLVALVQKLYEKEMKSGAARLVFIPHLGYEETQLEVFFPYAYLDPAQGELELYSYYQNRLRKIGFQAEIAHRDSATNLNGQIQKTITHILALPAGAKYIAISRSMGSMVMNGIKKLAEEKQDPRAVLAMQRIDSWLGVGGTPRGSVIAEYKSRPDVYYATVFPKLAGFANLPFELVNLDPRITSNLPETFREGLIRKNIPTMSFRNTLTQPTAAEALSSFPILNVVFLTPSFHRATDHVDVVYTDMMMYGPTEGSTRLADAAVDAPNSARLFYPLDHLAFWSLSKAEGFKVYLRVLVEAKRQGITYR